MKTFALKPLNWALAIAAALLSAQGAAQAETLLLRQPSVSAERLAFVYGGDIWTARRDGSEPRQLTSQASAEYAPKFSPDGRWIAFTANYDGNPDVYVMPAEGGEPRRLTWHPGADVVNGWSPDGKRILFSSAREIANSRSNQLFEVPVEGGPERKLMKAVAFEGAWNADGERLAYRPNRKAHEGAAGWRQSRGGATPPIWVLNVKTQQLEKVPHVRATDHTPMWHGDELVFVSDRNDGAANLYSWNGRTQQLRQLTRSKSWDVRSAGLHGSTVVYEMGGSLHQLDLKTGQDLTLRITLPVAGAQTREQWKDVSRQMQGAQLSPTGKRVLVTARGEVFSVPVKDGVTQNLTGTSGVREKDALWRPDGKQLAWLRDGGFKHELVLAEPTAGGKREVHALPAGYFTLLDWSPDGKRIALQDNHLQLYVYETEAKALKPVAKTPRRSQFEVSFSPDSRWLAYTIVGANQLSQIHLHDFQTGQGHMLSDGLAHAVWPAFSPKGDLLYFAASVNAGPRQVGLDMSVEDQPLRLGLYAAVLSSEGRSPLWPKTAEEEGPKAEGKTEGKTEGKGDGKGEAKPDPKADAKPDAKAEDKAKPSAKPTRIDIAGLQQRFVPLPVPERFYAGLMVAADGSLYYLDRRQQGVTNEGPDAESSGHAELFRFDMEERKPKSIKTGLSGASLSADGKKLLLELPKGKLEVADTGDKPDPKALDQGGLRARIQPREEWQQIFNEVWWMEKEYFYAPNLHGLDWDAVYKRYQPLLTHVQRREDLNEILSDMIGELQVAHNNVGGGDTQSDAPVSVGLLGADVEPHEGRWRLSKVYAGDRWNPFLKAPLAMPGLNVKTGDYVLAVNGQPVTAAQNFFRAFENTAGKQTTLTLADNPRGEKSRQVVVEPVGRDAALRQWDWIESNRAYVASKTGGKVGYIYLPDTGRNGFEYFNRQFFAQSDKEALIIDDRRNGGGHAANYILDVLKRPYLSGWKDRDAMVFNTPGSAVYGPKVMLIDQDAGSGGDYLPWAFRRLGLGPLIGTRTWGGLIGISANPPLIDNGFLTVPFFRFFTPDGEWRIENEGTVPDMDVDLDPIGVNRGQDSQLDAGIAEVMKRLASYQPVDLKKAPALPTELGK